MEVGSMYCEKQAGNNLASVGLGCKVERRLRKRDYFGIRRPTATDGPAERLSLSYSFLPSAARINGGIM